MLKNQKKQLSQLLFFASFLLILTVTKSAEAKCWKNQWGVKICDFEKPIGTPLEPILDTLDQAAIPLGMKEYIRSLEAQAQGKKQSLPSELVSAISGQYNNIDLSQVRYATGINTGHGQAITIGNNIYFPSSVDLNKRSQLNWMLHELEHVSQYEAHGGITPFLVKYVVQGGIQIFGRGHFNIHDNIGLERDAENKADRIDSEVAIKLKEFNSSENPRLEGSNIYLGGSLIDNNPKTIQVIKGANGVFQLHNDGQIWQWLGKPCDGNSCPHWVMIDNNPATKKITTAGNLGLFQLHHGGKIWQWKGQPCNGGSCPHWVMLDNNSSTIDIFSDGSRLLQRHNSGQQWEWLGESCSDWCHSWKTI